MKQTSKAPPGEKPKYVGIEVTRRCNLRCPHCFTQSGGKEHPGPDTDKLSWLVAELARAGIRDIAFSGGEPLLRKDLETVMERGRKAGVSTYSIVTNGSLATTARARTLRKAGLAGVQVSLDGVDAHDHGAVRACAPRAFYRALRAIRVFRETGSVVDVAAILVPANVDRAPELLELCDALGVRALRYCSFVPTGRAVDPQIRERFALPAEAADALLALMRLVRRQKEAPVGMLIDHGIGPWNAKGEFRCRSGEEVAYISAEGDVYPCPGLIFEPFRVGNVYETPVGELLEVEAMAAVRSIPKQELGEPCRSCEHDRCSGGCRGAAFAATGDVRAGVSYCNVLRRKEKATAQAEG